MRSSIMTASPTADAAAAARWSPRWRAFRGVKNGKGKGDGGLHQSILFVILAAAVPSRDNPAAKNRLYTTL